VGENIRLTVLSRSAAEGRGRMLLNPGDGDPCTVFVTGIAGNNYLCGKCGVTLLSQIPNLTFMNSALRCNKCGRFNNGFKPAKYPSKPTLLDEVEQLARPIERYSPIERPQPSPRDQVLDRLHQEFIGQWAEAQGQRPRKLMG